MNLICRPFAPSASPHYALHMRKLGATCRYAKLVALEKERERAQLALCLLYKLLMTAKPNRENASKSRKREAMAKRARGTYRARDGGERESEREKPRRESK